MKTNFTKVIPLVVLIIVMLSACSGSRYSMHNHRVDNRGYTGYSGY